MLDNDQEGGTASSQWALYSLGRRDVPPDNIMKKVGSVSSVGSETLILRHTLDLLIWVTICFHKKMKKIP